MFMKLYDLIVLVSVPRKYFFEIFSPNRKSAILDFVRIPSFYKSSFEAFTRHVNSWDVTATFRLLNFRFDIVFGSGRCTVAQYCPLVSFFWFKPTFLPLSVYEKSPKVAHVSGELLPQVRYAYRVWAWPNASTLPPGVFKNHDFND